MKRTLTVLLFFFFLPQIHAQGEFNNWFFGQFVGVTFVNGVPQSNGLNSISSGEGIATISDGAGNLLFYTNGVKVWNRMHRVMPNGGDLQGDLSSSQGALIVPRPGNVNQYYIFTVGGMEKGIGDLRYSLIDMSLGNGNGDVSSSEKNFQLTAQQAEKLVSAPSSRCGIWVLSHHVGTNAFEARLVTNAGIADPVISYTGAVHNHPVGTMKMTRDGRKIVAAVTSGIVQVLDFDPATGTVSNPVTLPVTSGNFSFSACLSPDGSKAYVVEGKVNDMIRFYQFDLQAPDISGSKTLVGITYTGNEMQTSDIQEGPDGKLYFTRMATSCIGVIPDPNQKAPLCGFNAGVLCNLGTVGLCLPNNITPRPSLVNLDLGPDTTLCPGETLSINTAPANAAYLWSTGATTPSIIANTSGQYWLQISDGSCKSSDTVLVSFDGRRIVLQNDTAICKGTGITLTQNGFTSYNWQDGTSQPTYTISTPGLYWLETVDRCGVRSRDSVLVTEKQFNVISSDAITRCSNDTIAIQAMPGYASYSWGPDHFASGLQSLSLQVAPPADTSYYVRAEAGGGCFAYDTVRVHVVAATDIDLGMDTLICPGTTLDLTAPGGFVSYTWSNGSMGTKFSTGDEGPVWLSAVDNRGCRSRDSLIVSWKDCPFDLWMPNAFTPNDDGNNDVFRARYTGLLKKFEFIVYNRWGQRVFASTQPASGWDGRIGGRKVDSGVYIWVCHYHFAGDVPRTQKGTVTLVR